MSRANVLDLPSCKAKHAYVQLPACRARSSTHLLSVLNLGHANPREIEIV
jgi:hypothetical protein